MLSESHAGQGDHDRCQPLTAVSNRLAVQGKVRRKTRSAQFSKEMPCSLKQPWAFKIMSIANDLQYSNSALEPTPGRRFGVFVRCDMGGGVRFF
jgi:hypothetical protein